MKMTDNKGIKVAVYCRMASNPDPMTALYCRTAQQSGLGIKKQRELLSHFADEMDFLNPSWYIDDGKSVTTFDHPAMKRLI
jgi:hypothetical protein